MTDLLDLACREGLFLALIACLGAAPATYLPREFSASLRVAFAPVLGLAVGVCLFTSIEWFFDGDQVKWVVPLAAAVSLAECARRWLMESHWAHGSHQASSTPVQSASRLMAILQILLVCIAVSLPPAYLLASQHSVGPTAFEVYDSPGYVANVDGAQSMSIGKADHLKPPVQNYEIAHWVYEVQSNSRLDIAPLAAALNALFGLHETEVWAAYLLAVLVAGALALYASIRVTVGRRTWYAVVAAALFGGAFFLQLFTDGSQAGIAGLTCVVPCLILLRITKHDPSLPNFLISSLLLAGLSTLYPILVLPLVVTAALYLMGLALWKSRRNWVDLLHELIRDAGFLCAVIVVSSIFDLVAASRNVSSWLSLLEGNGAPSNAPQYHLGLGVVASWLLQTRDFYSVAFGPQNPFANFVPAVVIPLLIVLVAILGIRRSRATWAPLVFIVISALIATKQVALDSCTYCEDRSVLPVAPTALFVIFTAIASLNLRANLRGRSVVAAATASLLCFAGLSLNNERERFASEGIFLPDAIQTAIANIPRTVRPVELEGFGTVPFPAVLGEEAPAYEALSEATSHGISYLGHEPGDGVPDALGASTVPAKPSFHANYQYVLTRIPQIATGREIIFESDGVAVELRHEPLDVTIEAGLASPMVPSANGRVAGWVNGTLTFVVTGNNHNAERLKLKFILPNSKIRVQVQTGTRLSRSGTILDECIPVTGSSAVRTVHAFVPANVGIVLSYMQASYGRC